MAVKPVVQEPVVVSCRVGRASVRMCQRGGGCVCVGVYVGRVCVCLDSRLVPGRRATCDTPPVMAVMMTMMLFGLVYLRVGTPDGLVATSSYSV